MEYGKGAAAMNIRVHVEQVRVSGAVLTERQVHVIRQRLGLELRALVESQRPTTSAERAISVPQLSLSTSATTQAIAAGVAGSVYQSFAPSQSST